MTTPRWSRGVARRIGLGIAFVLLAAGCADDPHIYAGYTRSPTPSVATVALPMVDADGEIGPFEFRAAEDELLLVYFGYTSCPDVCPTTLFDVRTALAELGDDAAKVDLAMVTIDPAVDTDEVVAGYVRSFVDDAIALRTDDDTELRAAASAFGADYGVNTNDEGEPEVFHTGALYAVDAAGDLVLTWSFGTTASDMAIDMAEMLAGGRAG